MMRLSLELPLSPPSSTLQTTIPSCLTAARAAVDCAAKEIAIATATPNGVWQVQDAGLA